MICQIIIYIYQFLWGADGKEDISGYKRDDTGSNISIKTLISVS